MKVRDMCDGHDVVAVSGQEEDMEEEKVNGTSVLKEKKIYPK